MAVAKRPARSASTKTLRRVWVEAPIWLLVLLVPIVVDPQGRDVFRDVKLHLAQILALTSIALLLWQRRDDNRSWRWRDWSGIPVLRITVLIFVAAGLSLFVTQDRDYSVAAFFELSIGLACLGAWSLGWESRHLRRWLYAGLLPASILAGIGALQFHHLWYPFEFLASNQSERLQITSLAGASGDLAAYLVLPILITQAALQKYRKWRWLLSGLLLMLVYALVLTQSLTALLAAALGTVLLWTLSLPRRVLWVRGGVLLSIVLIVVLAFAPLRARVTRLGRVLSEGKVNAALTGRLDAWKAASVMWSDHAVLGVGHGAFRSEFGKTKLSLESDGDEFFKKHIFSNFSVAHNDYLQVLAEWGSIGFLALLSAIFILLRESIKLSASSTQNKIDRGLALSGLLAMALMSITYFPWHLALTAYLFILFIAWILALRRDQDVAAG